VNASIQSLDLSNNLIGAEGAKYIAEAMKVFLKNYMQK